jgi:exo-1,4-beta-D-glucosaminidase
MQRKRRRMRLVLCLTVIVLPRAFASRQSPNLTELESGWSITSANNISGDEALISQASYDPSRWYAVKHMPATVLQVLEDNGVYKNLYYGMNLTAPGDLWKQDWWYRTTFSAPAGRDLYSLIFKGIDYRADAL